MKPILWIVPCLLAWCGLARAADGPTLHHDPFARPDLSASPPGAAASGPATPVWQPRLRAVVVAGRRSLAKVDDSVVELGGEVDGYRLIQVLPDKAIFVRAGRRVELTIGVTTGAARAP